MADTKNLNPQFWSQVQALINASGGKLTVTSGFRSPEAQARAVADAKRKWGDHWRRWAAPVGGSNHQRGLAADIGPAEGSGLSKGQAYQMIARLAPTVGLTLPMSWEPWHVEPAGVRAKGARGAAAQGPTARGHTPPPDPNDPADLPRLAAQQLVEPTPDDLGNPAVQAMALFDVIADPVGIEEYLEEMARG